MFARTYGFTNSFLVEQNLMEFYFPKFLVSSSFDVSRSKRDFFPCISTSAPMGSLMRVIFLHTLHVPHFWTNQFFSLLLTIVPHHLWAMIPSEKPEPSSRKTKSYRGCRRCKYVPPEIEEGIVNDVLRKARRRCTEEKPICSWCEKAGYDCNVSSCSLQYILTLVWYWLVVSISED